MYEILLTDGVKYPVRASRVDGFRTMSHCVYEWWLVARDERFLGCYATLSGIEGQSEKCIGFRGGLFPYEVTVMVEDLDK
jgi:hypothetical protein